MTIILCLPYLTPKDPYLFPYFRFFIHGFFILYLLKTVNAYANHSSIYFRRASIFSFFHNRQSDMEKRNRQHCFQTISYIQRF